MEYPFELTKANFNNLKELGMYDEKILEELKQKRYDILETLDISQREDRNFMEPLLYAVANEYNSYDVYKYMGVKLQGLLAMDYSLACDIVIKDPDTMENTPLAEEKNVILANVNSNTEILKYVSPKLENDREFIADLSQNTNPEVAKAMVEKISIDKIIAANPDVVNNKDFMVAAISKDVTSLKYFDSEILNNYDVFKEAAANNKQLVDYVIENCNDLGINAISGVRDTVKDETEKDYMKVIDENIEKGQDDRFAKLKAKVAKGDTKSANPRMMAAMVSKAETVDINKVEEVISYANLTMIKLSRILESEPEHKILKDEALELIPPTILNRLISKVPEKENVAHLQSKVEEYSKFYDEFHERFNAQKREEFDKEYLNNLGVVVLSHDGKNITLEGLGTFTLAKLPDHIKGMIQAEGLGKSKVQGESEKVQEAQKASKSKSKENFEMDR